ncbi:hypothetical protein [Roseobacter sp. HKCCA0434]|uniref:hypothetical protein n=1 Tax=Roseobacter sp. HKCCA0434 TaxID=3079297 RepID=UPI002905BEFE|nr:hypothetical protein [Roseobacter sp. HKCCA0434]
MAEIRKSAQEVEIDHLLAEEFCCDRDFARRFLDACGSDDDVFHVEEAIAEPSLGGEGFGDLLVTGTGRDGMRRALLVENKIGAAAGHRQAERYSDHADRMRAEGWAVETVLVAPASYRGERDAFDLSADLEAVSDAMRNPDDRRLAWRRGIIARALQKKATGGVRIPDAAVHALKKAYLAHMAELCARRGEPFAFPALAAEYYDGDSWVWRIRHADLREGIELRHRLWTTLKDPAGAVDLIVRDPSDAERHLFREEPPEGATHAPFSKGRGDLVSIRLPEMRAADGFDPAIGDAAFEAMVELTKWYLDARI